MQWICRAFPINWKRLPYKHKWKIRGQTYRLRLYSSHLFADALRARKGRGKGGCYGDVRLTMSALSKQIHQQDPVYCTSVSVPDHCQTQQPLKETENKVKTRNFCEHETAWLSGLKRDVKIPEGPVLLLIKVKLCVPALHIWLMKGDWCMICGISWGSSSLRICLSNRMLGRERDLYLPYLSAKCNEPIETDLRWTHLPIALKQPLRPAPSRHLHPRRQRLPCASGSAQTNSNQIQIRFSNQFKFQQSKIKPQ